MLRVRVSAAHIGGFLDPKFSKQGSLYRQILLKHGWFFQKFSKMGSFPPKFMINVGMTVAVSK